MRITFLGHAGFCVETSKAVLIADPWLSPTGAFDAAWFQFPQNHHLAAYVQEKLSDSRKERYVYISHEHKDHFDIPFLNSLESRDFTFVLPKFRRDHLRSVLADYECKGMMVCPNDETFEIAGGTVTLFLDDSELNRDSSILIKDDASAFLDMNDCRLYDALPAIVRRHKRIDVFAAQFSGAGWHPTCYDYSRERYEAISRRKMMGKFRAVEQSIRLVRPRVFLPSAGPPCFLDPTLFHLNLERVNIFPRASKLIGYLDETLRDLSTTWPELMPGDVVDVASARVAYQAKQRVRAEEFADYVGDYAAAYDGFFGERRVQYAPEDVDKICLRLRDELAYKLDQLTLRTRVAVPLYFGLSDWPDRVLRVDFQEGRVEPASAIPDRDFYSISAPSWEVARLLDGKLTWDDFSLTFRMRLNRAPDVYQTILHGFLHLEPEDMNWFCAKVLNIEANQERIVKECNGRRYVVDRYCPHQGGDLTHAWVDDDGLLTCPRHGWQFDLDRDGKSLNNLGTVNAVCLDDD